LAEEAAKFVPKISLRDILPYCENNLCLTPTGKKSQMLEVAFGVQSEALPARDWEGQGEELSEFDSSFEKKSGAQAISSQDSQK